MRKLIVGLIVFGAWLAVVAGAGCRKYGSGSSAVPTPSAKQQLQYAREARSDVGRLSNAQELLKRSPEELKSILPELQEAVKEKNYPQVTDALKQALKKAEGGAAQ